MTVMCPRCSAVLDLTSDSHLEYAEGFEDIFIVVECWCCTWELNIYVKKDEIK